VAFHAWEDGSLLPSSLHHEERMRQSWSTYLVLILLFAAAACGGDGPAGPDDGGGGDSRLTARIDGSSWSAIPSSITTHGTASQIPGSLYFQGATTSGGLRSLAFQLGRIPGPGIFPLGVNNITGAGGTATMTVGTTTWLTALSGAAGSITITQLTDTRAVGTFSFVAEPLIAGEAPAITVTDGQFDLPRSSTWVPVSTDQVGSRVTATIDTGLWNAATIVGVGGGESTVGFTAANTAYSLTLLTGPITGPESGPLSTTVPLRRIRVQRIQDGAGWGGTAADEGTLAVTSLSATRMGGTFSGTLAPSIPSSGLPLLSITDGTFDVRIAP
jgi:hypothetical protein